MSCICNQQQLFNDTSDSSFNLRFELVFECFALIWFEKRHLVSLYSKTTAENIREYPRMREFGGGPLVLDGKGGGFDAGYGKGGGGYGGRFDAGYGVQSPTGGKYMRFCFFFFDFSLFLSGTCHQRHIF